MDFRHPAASIRMLIRPVALLAALALAAGLLLGFPSAARADGLTSLTLVNGNATGTSVSLSPQPTPYLFTGIANAADDTINVLATFTSGTASVTTAVGSGAASAPVTVVSGVETPVPLASGTNEIVVTHVDTTTTTYTLRVYRAFPITGFEIINADDSSVIISKTGGSFDPSDQDDTALVPHGVYRIRARMFYDTPTEPSALPAEALVWTGCVGCSFNMVTSGQWSTVTNLNTGSNVVAFYPVVSPWWNYRGTAWNVRITRDAAFNSSTLGSLSLVNANGTGGSINLAPESTPYLFSGIANAVDDTVNVLATFDTGTASVSVSVGSGPSSTPITLQSGVETPVPLSSGTNNIVVTHVGAATTDYTLRVYRSFPITGFEIINADDSSVIISKTGGSFDLYDRDDTALVPHGVSRIRARMFYDTPTEPSALPAEALIWTGCVGCSFNMVTSGQWSPITNLNSVDNNVSFYSVVSPWSTYRGTAWNVRITRQTAFNSDTISSLTLVDGNATGTSVSLSPEATPYLFSGIANAADDTINVNAVFSAGTTTVTVAVGAASPSAPITVLSGINTPVPLSSGINTIVVEHTDGPTVTTYTLRITRSWPISGYEIISADDSTVLASKTGPGFDPADQDDTLFVPHDADTVRVRMFYTDPTEPTALPTHATIWWGCGVGCSGPATVTSGEWSTPISLSVGEQTLGLYASINNWYPYEGTRWNIRTTRATAFASITRVDLPGVPSVGTPVPAGTPISVTPIGVTGTPPPTVTYDWEATESLVSPDWELIESTTSSTFTPDNDVADQYIRVTATADNGVSTPMTVTSTPFGPIAEVDEAPRFRETVTVTGSPNVGSTLSVTTGRVTGRPAPTITYQWEIADDSASAFAPIAGATGASYRLTAADVEKIVRVVATAANGIGSDATGTSAATAPISGASSPPGGGGDARVVPGRPLDVSAVAGVRSAIVSWEHPATPGDFGITSYRVTSSTGKQACVVPVDETSCRIRRLPADTPVTFTVRALSGAGWGEVSAASEAVNPLSPGDVVLELEGSRDGRRVTLSGAVAYFPPGSEVTIRVRTSPRGRFSAARRPAVLDADGAFMWQRNLARGRTLFAYAVIEGVRSEVIVLRRERRT